MSKEKANEIIESLGKIRSISWLITENADGDVYPPRAADLIIEGTTRKEFSFTMNHWSDEVTEGNPMEDYWWFDELDTITRIFHHFNLLPKSIVLSSYNSSEWINKARKQYPYKHPHRINYETVRI